MPNTFGVVQVGGASAQITFQIEDEQQEEQEDKPVVDLHNVDVQSTAYKIYSRTFLCRGMSQTIQMYMGKKIRDANYTSEQPIDAPCYPIGYEFAINGSQILELDCIDGLLFDESFAFTLDMTRIDPRATYRIRGSSNPHACRRDMTGILPDFPPCEFGSELCAIDGAYRPKIPNVQFAVISTIKLYS